MSIATQRTASMASRPKQSKTAQIASDKNDRSYSPAQSAPIAETAPETIEIQLAGWTITVDYSDVSRIAEHEWKLGWFAGVRRIYKEHPVPQLLTGFLLGVDPTVFVDIQKPWAYNHSKSNLFIYRPKGELHK
jgi:hypothetical protein